jgi:hypothetical protein
VGAFTGCSLLRSLHIPAYVETLVRGCFYGCGIETLTIESGSKLCQIAGNLASFCWELCYISYVVHQVRPNKPGFSAGLDVRVLFGESSSCPNCFNSCPIIQSSFVPRPCLFIL